MWQAYLELIPFQLGLHGTMRLVYLAVYNSYENFLVQALSIALGGKRIRVTDQSFKADFRAVLGDLIDDAWFRQEIHLARLVRHALAHAGGRVTDELQKHVIPLEVHEGYLHVFPEHISALYRTLQAPALAIMRAACFRQSDTARDEACTTS